MPTSDSPWLDKTLTDLLRENVQKTPDAPAIEWEILLSVSLIWISKAIGCDRISRTGDWSWRRGLLSTPQYPGVLVLHHAVSKRRAIFNPIHMPYRSSEMEHILGFAESAMLVTGPPVKGFSYAEIGMDIQKGLPSLRHVVSLGEEQPPGSLSLEELGESSQGHRRKIRDLRILF